MGRSPPFEICTNASIERRRSIAAERIRLTGEQPARNQAFAAIDVSQEAVDVAQLREGIEAALEQGGTPVALTRQTAGVS